MQLQVITSIEIISIFSHFTCRKMKMLNKEFGGTVTKKDIREDGQFRVTVETSSALFRFVVRKTTLIRKSLILYSKLTGFNEIKWLAVHLVCGGGRWNSRDDTMCQLSTLFCSAVLTDARRWDVSALPQFMTSLLQKRSVLSSSATFKAPTLQYFSWIRV